MRGEARDDHAGATTPTRWYRPAQSSAATCRPAHLLQGIGRQVSEVAPREAYPPCTGDDISKRLMDSVRRATGAELMRRLLDQVQIEIDVRALDHGDSIHPTWSYRYTCTVRHPRPVGTRHHDAGQKRNDGGVASRGRRGHRSPPRPRGNATRPTATPRDVSSAPGAETPAQPTIPSPRTIGPAARRTTRKCNDATTRLVQALAAPSSTNVYAHVRSRGRPERDTGGP